MRKQDKVIEAKIRAELARFANPANVLEARLLLVKPVFGSERHIRGLRMLDMAEDVKRLRERYSYLRFSLTAGTGRWADIERMTFESLESELEKWEELEPEALEGRARGASA